MHGTREVPERPSAKEVYDMTLVRRTSPLGELVSLRQAMDRLFEDSFVRPRGLMFGGGDGYGIAMDVTNRGDSLVIEASLPGYRPEDVDITVENGALSITAQTQSERTEGEGESLMTEIRRGSVSRTVALPTGLEPDKATATFENGVLRLEIPKAESVKPRQIRISPTSNGTSTNGSETRLGLSGSETDTESETARTGA
jgi:HSP20 family protein